MKRLAIIYRREMSFLSQSFIAYLLIALFVAISGYFFVSLTASFSVVSAQWKSIPGVRDITFNLTEMVLTNLHMNIVVVILFFIPILTMRSFAEEARQGTLELLLTLPVKDYEVVFGKYFAYVTLYLFMILPFLLFPLLIYAVGGAFEWGTVLSGFLGLFLLGMCFTAIGIFASSSTENQVISAVIAFAILMVLWVIGWLADLGSAPYWGFLSHLSAMEHFKSLAKGVIDLKDVGYYVLLTLFFLYAALTQLESRTVRK